MMTSYEDRATEVAFYSNVTLKRAGDLLDTYGWTRGEMARDAYDNPLNSVTSPHACQFCMVGAVRRALCELLPVDIDADEHAQGAVAELARFVYYDVLLRLRRLVGDNETCWNDYTDRKRAQVVLIYERAAAFPVTPMNNPEVYVDAFWG